jgi:uncharacterized RDD family membrane protein YckC
MSCPTHALAEVTAPCARCGVGYCDDCLVVLRDQRLCAPCKEEVVRDVISGAVDRGLPLASFVPRFAAWFIDRVMVWLGQLSATGVAFSTLPRHSPHLAAFQAALQFSVALLFFLYEGATVATYGKTVGKLALRIRVVRPDGTTLFRRQGWIRAAVRLGVVTVVLGISLTGPGAEVIASILLALGDYIPGLLTRERTTVHDLIAGTRVVRETS